MLCAALRRKLAHRSSMTLSAAMPSIATSPRKLSNSKSVLRAPRTEDRPCSYHHSGREAGCKFLFSASRSARADNEVRVKYINTKSLPAAFTSYHLHNGATFFICLQGEIFFSRIRQDARPPEREATYRADLQ